MLDVFVCIGTSCHLRGGERVAEQLVSLVRENDLESSVQVRGAFCLEHCSAEGVSVKIGERVLAGITPDNARETLLPELMDVVGAR